MTSQTTSVPEPLLDHLRRGHRFVLTSHVNPDGDAIGSEIGLARILRKLGKSTVIWNRDPVPDVYRPLAGSDRVHVGDVPPPGWPEQFDAVIVLECPSRDRTGLEAHWNDRPVLNVDHHLGNEQHGIVNWIDTAAPAVGEMVFRIGRALRVPIDDVTANALYLAVVTDTGGFRYSNTTPETFVAAAELMRAGASPETVSAWLYESRPESSLRLLSESLASLQMHAGGRVATIRLDLSMVERAGAGPGDSEGLIDHPRSIAGVEAVALLKQRADGGTKVSLRSKGRVNVEKVARRFGGGGHHNAAGFSSDEAIDRLHPTTVDALVGALETE